MADVRQGEIYWLVLESAGSTIPHPYVVIQDDVLNQSRLETVIVCALTSNLKRANLPGHVLLEPGEGNLPRQSVVEISKVSSVPKSQFGECIGTLSVERIDQIFAGMDFLQRLFSRDTPQH